MGKKALRWIAILLPQFISGMSFFLPVAAIYLLFNELIERQSPFTLPVNNRHR